MSEVTVYDNDGREVPAKILRDPSGRAIVDPVTGLPLLVDEHFDMDRAIAFGRWLRDPPVDPYSQSLPLERKAAVYGAMIDAFQDGGPLDVQRSYNKKVGGGRAEYVKAFRPAASYIYGLAARAAGLIPDEIIAGAGLYNLSRRVLNPNINTSGPWFNAPQNLPWIEEGMKAHDSGRFFKPDPGPQGRTDRTPEGSSADAAIMGGQPPPRQEQPPMPNFAAAPPQPNNPQMTHTAQPRGYPQVTATAGPGLPQHVIDTGNLLRANGYEITPRTMYVSHVLGPQAAVELQADGLDLFPLGAVARCGDRRSDAGMGARVAARPGRAGRRDRRHDDGARCGTGNG